MPSLHRASTDALIYLAIAVDVVDVSILRINSALIVHRVAGKSLEVVDCEVKLAL